MILAYTLKSHSLPHLPSSLTRVYLASLEEISAELQVTATVVNLSVAVYLIAMSVFPLWWSSFSETLGRRSIYLASFALNVAFSAASGGSQVSR